MKQGPRTSLSPPRQNADNGRTAHPQRLRLVLADDYEPMRALLSAWLQQSDAIELIGAAGDGREAVELAVAAHADAVLLDIDMPRCDGVRAAEALRATLPGASIMLFSR